MRRRSLLLGLLGAPAAALPASAPARPDTEVLVTEGAWTIHSPTLAATRIVARVVTVNASDLDTSRAFERFAGRVLFTGQADPSRNGVWMVRAEASDRDTSQDFERHGAQLLMGCRAVPRRESAWKSPARLRTVQHKQKGREDRSPRPSWY